MKEIIKSSKHSTKFANSGKQADLLTFLTEYNRVKWALVDYLWTTKINWSNKILDIKNNKLDVPNFISTTELPIETNLSARALKLASAEALGIIDSQVTKRRKQLFVLKRLQKEQKFGDCYALQSKIDSTPLIKPSQTSANLYANLDSNCCEYIQTDRHFNGFLKIHALGKEYGHIYIPIQLTKHSKKLLSNDYNLMTSWHIGEKDVTSRWKKSVEKSTGTKIIGADQGFTTCLSLSDSQVTGKCSHGHDLASIIAGMGKKKKGSKAYKKAQHHRTNYINWAINQLNLSDVSELRLEKLHQMRYGQSMGKSLSSWTYTEINTKISRRCEELGVPVIEQSATYRSQRCSTCGFVHKSNRKRKEFICRSCGNIADADINGALNHEADLYRLPFGIRQSHLNKIGFFWTSDGIYDEFGQALTVPDVPN